MTLLFIGFGFGWYKFYVQKRVTRDSALLYLLERLISKDVELTSDNILVELKEVVMERDKMVPDRFFRLIEEAEVLDMRKTRTFQELFKQVSEMLSQQLNVEPAYLFKKFLEREEKMSTVVDNSVAIPHIVISGDNIFKIVLVRACAGIIFPQDKRVNALFVLVGSPDLRSLHLKVLSAIAQVIQNPDFNERWQQAQGADDLKNVVLLSERKQI